MKNKRIGALVLLVLGMMLTGCTQPQIPDGEIDTSKKGNITFYADAREQNSP